MATILPKHPQHYPDKLLPSRIEEYVLDGGLPPTTNRSFAKRVTGQQVLDAITAVQEKIGLKNIDPRYYVGTCFHESGCTNEWDTEIASPSSPGGFVSVGAFQIGQEEAERFGFSLEDMLNLEKSCNCFVRLAEANRTSLRKYANITGEDPDYTDGNGVSWKGGTMRAFLGIAHNHGLGFARSVIAQIGMNWGLYQKNRPADNIVAHKYGTDCVTGGPNWPTPASTVPVTTHRTLSYQTPNMTGADVKELQRLMHIPEDGIFGSGTLAALMKYQQAHGLMPDGVCGSKTWAVLLRVEAE